jgi:hypothetical protein
MSAVKKLKTQGDAKSETLAGWDQFTAENSAPAWLNDVRRKGIEAFLAQGLPTKKYERYKYTDLPGAEAGRVFPQVQSPIRTTGNTKHVTQISGDAPEWVRDWAAATPAGEAQYKDMALWHAANAFLRDGVIVDVPKNTSGWRRVPSCAITASRIIRLRRSIHRTRM